jgi:ribosome-associated translation inhibitor RaiA
MIVQFNTDKKVAGDNNQQQYFTSLIEEKLDRFESNISRIEVHVSDKKGKKEGPTDIHCVMETRMEGRDPIAVSCDANNVHNAVAGAIDKTKAAMETILGKLQSTTR